MDLMADTVARPRIQHAFRCADALQIQMVIRVFRPHLARVVVDILNRKLCFYAFDAHGFQFQKRHRSRRILAERLVNANFDF